MDKELEDLQFEAEWELVSTKCDMCGATYFKENMWALGYGNKFLCDMCWDEAEEEDY